MAAAAIADENLASEAAALFGLGLNVGYISLPDTSGSLVGWNTLALTPDIAVGDFGIGLDVNLRYRFDGGNDGASFEIRAQDWVPDENNTFLDIYLPLFKYIRYGTKGKPLFISLGDIDNGTLGNGFLVGSYRNTLFKPEQRLFGMNLDVDGALIDFPYVGIETMISNLAAFDVLGARVFVRPGAKSGIALLEGTQIGLSIAGDTNPYYFDTNSTDGTSKNTHPAENTVVMFGLDFKQPFVSSDFFSLAFFGDVGIQNSRMGSQFGLGGRAFGFMNYLGLIRIMDSSYIPSYFDSSYDIMREEKMTLFLNGNGTTGTTAGWLGTLGFNFMNDALVFSTTVAAPFEIRPDILFQNPELKASLVLKDGIVGGLGLEAFYEKKNIIDAADLIDPTYALIGATISYKIGPAVLLFTYGVHYDSSAVDNPWVVSSKLETSIDLF